MADLPNAPTGLAIQLFGPFACRIFNEPLPRLRTRKGQQLLALLLLRPDTAVERMWLSGVLWPDSSTDQALANLRLSLTDLRKALGREADRLQSLTGKTLQFCSENAWIDLHLFDKGVGSPSLEETRSAVALYRGPLLEGSEEEWIFPERSSRELAFLEALERLAEHSRERGDWQAAEAYYRRSIATDPLREVAQRGLMGVLAERGQIVAAQQTYRDYRTYLHTQLNVQPSEETTRLYHSLPDLRGNGSRNVPSVSAVSAPIAGAGYAQCLPRPVTSLVGREEELRELDQDLSQYRLVTLTGIGGVGKTRLGIAVAEKAADRFSDGILYLDLAPMHDAHAVFREAAAALKLSEDAEPSLSQPLTERLVAALRNRALLLVLDNCEHLVAASSSLAVTLLTKCGGIRILATSRQPLGVIGERICRIPPLALPDPRSVRPHPHPGGTRLSHAVGEGRPHPCPSPKGEGSIFVLDGAPQGHGSYPAASKGQSNISGLLRHGSARLFCERAAAASSSFRVSSDNCGVIAHLCRLLEGIPLALELAAALVRVMPIEQIAARLDNHLSLPAADTFPRLSHQQTLEGMLDWSYHLLESEERTLLRRLSVFAHGWTLVAADAVCREPGQETLLPLLIALVDKSLVNYEEQKGCSRYRMLETTRQYARGKLTPEEWEQTSHLHADYYIELVRGESTGSTPPTYREMYALLEQEHHNILAALDWAASEKSAEQEARLATQLCRFWYQRGYLAEGRRRIEHALERLKDASAELRAEALNGAGSIAFSQGDYSAAFRFHSESLNLYKDLGNPYAVAVVLADLGLAAQQQKEYAFARARYCESLAIMTEIENIWGIGYSYSLLGTLAFDQADYEAASALFEKGLWLLMRAKDEANVALCHAYLGKIDRQRGSFADARRSFLSSLTLRAEQGDVVEIAYSLQDFAALAWAQDHGEDAARLSGAAEELRRLCALPLPVNERGEYEVMIDCLRAALGEECFAALRDEGHAMPLDGVVEYAKTYASRADFYLE